MTCASLNTIELTATSVNDLLMWPLIERFKVNMLLYLLRGTIKLPKWSTIDPSLNYFSRIVDGIKGSNDELTTLCCSTFLMIRDITFLEEG
jgi:hypothetical protein